MNEKAKRAPRIGRLNTIGQIANELGRLYRQVRKGEMDAEKGSKLAYMLTQQRAARESEIIEEKINRRLVELESELERLNHGKSTGCITATRALPNFSGGAATAED